jgi:hypothetical protein
MDYEGALRIPKNEKLPADEAELEARFAAQIQRRLDEVMLNISRGSEPSSTRIERVNFVPTTALPRRHERDSRARFTILPKRSLMRFTGAKSAKPRLRTAGAFYSRAAAPAGQKHGPGLVGRNVRA